MSWASPWRLGRCGRSGSLATVDRRLQVHDDFVRGAAQVLPQEPLDRGAIPLAERAQNLRVLVRRPLRSVQTREGQQLIASEMALHDLVELDELLVPARADEHVVE